METGHRKKRLIYTGTAFGGYGRMLRELARELEKQDEWELVIFGNTPDFWMNLQKAYELDTASQAKGAAIVDRVVPWQGTPMPGMGATA